MLKKFQNQTLSSCQLRLIKHVKCIRPNLRLSRIVTYYIHLDTRPSSRARLRRDGGSSQSSCLLDTSQTSELKITYEMTYLRLSLYQAKLSNYKSGAEEGGSSLRSFLLKLSQISRVKMTLPKTIYIIGQVSEVQERG